MNLQAVHLCASGIEAQTRSDSCICTRTIAGDDPLLSIKRFHDDQRLTEGVDQRLSDEAQRFKRETREMQRDPELSRTRTCGL